MQLNVVLGATNLDRLAELLPLARQAGCDQVFVALPDAAAGSPPHAAGPGSATRCSRPPPGRRSRPTGGSCAPAAPAARSSAVAAAT
ncbi:hypothetical protein ABXN37_13805 [Piscinibacter sakaiensis]